MYTIIGYDKDNDIYEEIAKFNKLEDAIESANSLCYCLVEDELKSCVGEPIDWLEVYFDWNGKNENKVWTSYE